MEESRLRTHEQNDKLHAMCRDFAEQATWAGSRWDEESWKRIFLGGKFGQPIVPNPFGHGIVCVNSKRSRELSVQDMAELLGEIEAFGVMQGVRWTDDE